MKQLSYYKAHCQGEVGLFFPDVGLQTCLLGAKNAIDLTGTSPVQAEGVREVWDAVTDGACLCLPVCSPLALLMLKAGGGGRREEDGALLARGSKSNENFSQAHPGGCEFAADQKAVETCWTVSKTGEKGYLKATFLS